MKTPIAILGAGNMASALALNLARHKCEVRLYSIESDVTEELNTKHQNTKYLAGHAFPKHVRATSSIKETVLGADVVFVAVPSFAVKDVIQQAKPFLKKNVIIASITKGIDPNTLEPLVIAEAHSLPHELRKRVCSIGGPAIANEMAKGSPTALVIAGGDAKSTQTIKRLLETPAVKATVSRDIKGVGLAAALKNPYAIALGMCDGLQYPTNAKALVFTIAIEEMSDILRRAGARPETVTGLAGLGDLIVTGLSPHGRNRTYGERLVGAKSKEPKDLDLITVEGIAATVLAVKLARSLKANTPLLFAIDQCLRAKKDFEKPFVTFLHRLKLA